MTCQSKSIPLPRLGESWMLLFLFVKLRFFTASDCPLCDRLENTEISRVLMLFPGFSSEVVNCSIAPWKCKGHGVPAFSINYDGKWRRLNKPMIAEEIVRHISKKTNQNPDPRFSLINITDVDGAYCASKKLPCTVVTLFKMSIPSNIRFLSDILQGSQTVQVIGVKNYAGNDESVIILRDYDDKFVQLNSTLSKEQYVENITEFCFLDTETRTQLQNHALGIKGMNWNQLVAMRNTLIRIRNQTPDPAVKFDIYRKMSMIEFALINE